MAEGKPSGQGIMRVVRAFGWSLAGLRAAFAGEAAFRQEVAVALLLTPLALWLGQTGVERALLLSSLLLVLLAELLNSAIEAVVDRVGSEHHPLSGRAKDIGSGAVFISLVNAAVVWGFIFFGRC
ncbi:MAG: diacylglycerol kinase [Desulfobulbaceae bacterium]|nr:diacylglycerol kinase [Desulfobulbaceae bacterium]